MSLDIRKLLVISTGHVTDEETRESLDRSFDQWSVNGGPTSYGWLCYANEEDPSGDIAPDLWRCMVFARLHGCDYILFDRGAEPAESLAWVEY